MDYEEQPVWDLCLQELLLVVKDRIETTNGMEFVDKQLALEIALKLIRQTSENNQTQVTNL